MGKIGGDAPNVGQQPLSCYLSLPRKMNRRLRKKKRVGEFNELGFEVRVELRAGLSDADFEVFIDRWIEAIEAQPRVWWRRRARRQGRGVRHARRTRQCHRGRSPGSRRLPRRRRGDRLSRGRPASRRLARVELSRNPQRCFGPAYCARRATADRRAHPDRSGGWHGRDVGTSAGCPLKEHPRPRSQYERGSRQVDGQVRHRRLRHRDRAGDDAGAHGPSRLIACFG